MTGICKLCDREIDKESEKPCKNPEQHEAKFQIAELLVELKTCESKAEQDRIINEIKKLEKDANLDVEDCRNFDQASVKRKLGLR